MIFFVFYKCWAPTQKKQDKMYAKAEKGHNRFDLL